MYIILHMFILVVKILPVVGTDGNLVSGEDITSRFTFDDGQRDTFIDVSKLVLKPGFDPPNGQMDCRF